MSEKIDLEQLCKDVNRYMDWMRFGVDISVFISIASIVMSSFAVYMVNK